MSMDSTNIYNSKSISYISVVRNTWRHVILSLGDKEHIPFALFAYRESLTKNKNIVMATSESPSSCSLRGKSMQGKFPRWDQRYPTDFRRCLAIIRFIKLNMARWGKLATVIAEGFWHSSIFFCTRWTGNVLPTHDKGSGSGQIAWRRCTLFLV